MTYVLASNYRLIDLLTGCHLTTSKANFIGALAQMLQTLAHAEEFP